MITYAIACADLLTAAELAALRAQAARAEQLEGALLTAENHLRHALAARRADDKHLAILRARHLILAVIPEEQIMKPLVEPRARRDARAAYRTIAIGLFLLAGAVLFLVDIDAAAIVLLVGVLAGLLWDVARNGWQM